MDAEFLALRRSKAFLLQHLTAYALLLMPIYATILSVTALLVAFSRKLLPVAAVRIVLVPLAAAVLFVFSDNLLRAAAALMALDEQSPRQEIPIVPSLLETGQGDAGPAW